MGFLFSSPKPQPKPVSTLQSQIQSVDVIKVKLKHVRDRLKQYINLKTKEQQAIDQRIKDLIPQYKQTGCKKKMVPYLSVKKTIKMNIEQAQMQLTLIIDQLGQVEISDLNKQTIDAVEQANKHVEEIMRELEAKDWQKVLAETKNQYQIDWKQLDNNLQEDETFKELWDQIGGGQLDDKVGQKESKGKNHQKVVEGKKVSVELPHERNHEQQKHKEKHLPKAQQFA